MTLPSPAFPHELDTLTLPAEGETAVAITLGGESLFEATLQGDDSGEIVLTDLRELIAARADEIGSPAVLTVTAGDLSASTTVLPCRCRPTQGAAAFAQARFLTMCPLERTTYMGALEALHVYDPDAATRGTAPTVSLKATWLVGTATQTTDLQATCIDISGAAGVYTYVWMPTALEAPAAGAELLQVAAFCGRRRQVYTVRPAADADREARSLTFRSAFGLADVFHLYGNADREFKAERTAAALAGRGYTVVRAVPTPQWKLRTGPLTPDLLPLLDDLLTAPYVERAADGEPMAVTDHELKHEVGARYALPEATLTLRECASAPLEGGAAPARVWDQTFGAAF